MASLDERQKPESSGKILLVEDEIGLAEALGRGLEEEGFVVSIASSGEKALRLVDRHWDLVILDLMLPDLSGESVLDYLKQSTDHPPVLVLTARSSLQDKLSLFRQGCDDYVIKPFIFEELLERVRALLRRSPRATMGRFTYEDLSLDPETFRLFTSKAQVSLTPKEAAILRLLMAAPGKVISRKELLHRVWGLKEEPDTNFIGVHLFNLRKKLAEVGKDSWLSTVRNAGFMLSSRSQPVHEA